MKINHQQFEELMWILDLTLNEIAMQHPTDTVGVIELRERLDRLRQDINNQRLQKMTKTKTQHRLPRLKRSKEHIDDIRQHIDRIRELVRPVSGLE